MSKSCSEADTSSMDKFHFKGTVIASKGAAILYFTHGTQYSQHRLAKIDKSIFNYHAIQLSWWHKQRYHCVCLRHLRDCVAQTIATCHRRVVPRLHLPANQKAVSSCCVLTWLVHLNCILCRERHGDHTIWAQPGHGLESLRFVCARHCLCTQQQKGPLRM